MRILVFGAKATCPLRNPDDELSQVRVRQLSKGGTTS